MFKVLFEDAVRFLKTGIGVFSLVFGFFLCACVVVVMENTAFPVADVRAAPPARGVIVFSENSGGVPSDQDLVNATRLSMDLIPFTKGSRFRNKVNGKTHRLQNDAVSYTDDAVVVDSGFWNTLTYEQKKTVRERLVLYRTHVHCAAERAANRRVRR